MNTHDDQVCNALFAINLLNLHVCAMLVSGSLYHASFHYPAASQIEADMSYACKGKCVSLLIIHAAGHKRYLPYSAYVPCNECRGLILYRLQQIFLLTCETATQRPWIYRYYAVLPLTCLPKDIFGIPLIDHLGYSSWRESRQLMEHHVQHEFFLLVRFQYVSWLDAIIILLGTKAIVWSHFSLGATLYLQV